MKTMIGIRRIFHLTMIVLWMLSVEVYTTPEIAFRNCERKCLIKRDTCSLRCRMKRIKNFRRKMRIIGCLSECGRDYIECEGECACSATCARERLGCQFSCQWYPFISRWNRKQCREECYHENEYCRDICWENLETLKLTVSNLSHVPFKKHKYVWYTVRKCWITPFCCVTIETEHNRRYDYCCF